MNLSKHRNIMKCPCDIGGCQMVERIKTNDWRGARCGKVYPTSEVIHIQAKSDEEAFKVIPKHVRDKIIAERSKETCISCGMKSCNGCSNMKNRPSLKEFEEMDEVEQINYDAQVNEN